ncbi:MAG: pantoate--beta-alanine ligase [Gammaproteobacteria bacterium]|nr:pantoate--beta-alanine ligase [Gammaproteobacteria bacterium]
MNIIQNLDEWQAIRESIPNSDSIGFVPTMGCLHQGHASLIKQSTADNALTIVSLFVNPTQFNNNSDFQNYPITFDSDCELANRYGADYLLVPDKQAMYPDGNKIGFSINHEFAKILEGEYRNNHFNGVLTVVMKLLNLVRPQQLYLGEKDYQQYVLLDHMVKNYFIPTRVIMCPTIRDASGLALSSRNQRLSEKEQHLARQFAQLLHQCSASSLEQTKQAMIDLGIQPEYLEVHNDRLFAAAYIKDVRLIDNILLTENENVNLDA